MNSESQLDAWVAALAADLGVTPPAIDVQLLLDVARDAAHSVTRPAAPLATFMVGYAAGVRSTEPDAIGHAAHTATESARRWREAMPG